MGFCADAVTSGQDGLVKNGTQSWSGTGNRRDFRGRARLLVAVSPTYRQRYRQWGTWLVRTLILGMHRLQGLRASQFPAPRMLVSQEQSSWNETQGLWWEAQPSFVYSSPSPSLPSELWRARHLPSMTWSSWSARERYDKLSNSIIDRQQHSNLSRAPSTRRDLRAAAAWA